MSAGGGWQILTYTEKGGRGGVQKRQPLLRVCKKNSLKISNIHANSLKFITKKSHTNWSWGEGAWKMLTDSDKGG